MRFANLRSVGPRWRASIAAAVLLGSIVALHLTGFASMTIAGILAIVILAFANAWAGIDESEFALENAEAEPAEYFRRFFRVEAFWRAFVTNLSFGAVSLALAVIALKSAGGFWDWDNPILPLCANFVMGVWVAPRGLKNDYGLDGWPPRHVWVVVGIGLLLYIYAGWSAYALYK